MKSQFMNRNLFAVLLLFVACQSTPENKPLKSVTVELYQDQYKDLALKYAPFIYHSIEMEDREKGRQDLPTRMDYDGDWRGDNNWDNFAKYKLPPVIYYGFLQSKTHYFISYHIFHPRDWSTVNLGLHESHENDGENLQVVVDKKTGRVLCLYTQAHYFGYVYTPANSLIGPSKQSLRGRLVLVNEKGQPDPAGHHPAIYVQSGGHGIYSVTDKCSQVTISKVGAMAFSDTGILFRPGKAGDEFAEPKIVDKATVPYELASTIKTLWPRYQNRTLMGTGNLLDGGVPLQGKEESFIVPRYYEANRFSGPFGPDRGISPFALGFRFCKGELGNLFFDPAQTYKDNLTVPEEWSLDYIDSPFLNRK